LKACDKTRPSKHEINHKRTDDLIPCLHFSENFKNLENMGGVKSKHLLEIHNTRATRKFGKSG